MRNLKDSFRFFSSLAHDTHAQICIGVFSMISMNIRVNTTHRVTFSLLALELAGHQTPRWKVFFPQRTQNKLCASSRVTFAVSRSLVKLRVYQTFQTNMQTVQFSLLQGDINVNGIPPSFFVKRKRAKKKL